MPDSASRSPASAPLVQVGGARRPGVKAALSVHGLLLAVWLTAFFAARLLEYAPHASLWFPPAAISFAAFLVFGRQALPTVLLACVLATLATNAIYAQGLDAWSLLLSSATFAGCHAFSYALAALVLRRLARGQARVASMRRTVTVFLLGGVLATALAALTGAVGLSLTGMIAVADVPSLLVPWMIGDYAGLIALGPLAIMLLRRLGERVGMNIDHGLPRLDRSADSCPPRRWKLALLLGVSALVLLLAALFPAQPAVVFVLFLAVVIQLWIVHTEKAEMALSGIALFSLLLAAATPLLDLQAHALTLQFAMISLAANSYFGLAVPELYADNARLRHLLTHDALTGALSRSFFEERAREGLAHSHARGESAALLMIDLDRLKEINDSLGHAAGDAALRALATRCLTCLRPGDLFGRLSGDEFGAFLPSSGHDSAVRIAERMREALAGAQDAAGTPALSASIGVAAAVDRAESYETLLGRADQAMYRQKRGERAG